MNTVQKGPRLNEYKVGPEPDGIRTCIDCGQEIKPGQVWLKQWAPGSDYAIGVHVTCRKFQTLHAGPQVAKHAECCLCGHITKDAAEMALHFRLIHRVAFGVRLEALVA